MPPSEEVQVIQLDGVEFVRLWNKRAKELGRSVNVLSLSVEMTFLDHAGQHWRRGPTGELSLASRSLLESDPPHEPA